MTKSSFMSCVPNFQKGEKAHTAATESPPRSFTQSKSKIKLQTENNWLRKKDLFLFLIICMRVCVCLPLGICPRVQVPTEVSRGLQSPGSWSYRWLWCVWWGCWELSFGPWMPNKHSQLLSHLSSCQIFAQSGNIWLVWTTNLNFRCMDHLLTIWKEMI